MTQSQAISAFLVGLLGGVHCVGMCGGIVGALTMTLPTQYRKSPARMLPFMLAYNTGRLGSYVLAGALVGGVGYVAANLPGLYRAQTVLAALAGLFMIALGLYLGGWWFGVARLEAVGGWLWKHVEPVGRRWLPVSTPLQAFVLGLLWGWLPCGLVYSVLVWSLSTGSAAGGALLMLSFGLGTLPTLLALGTVAARLSTVVSQPWVRRVAGALVASLGLAQLWRAF